MNSRRSNPFIFIAGPCVIESEQLVIDVAGRLKELTDPLVKAGKWSFYFKSSFDKANRSAYDSYRGPGLERGLEILSHVKKQLGVKVLTDVHEVGQCAPVANIVDALQIPAFLCRQTDLIHEAARLCHQKNLGLNVKKGQFLAPADMKNVVEKVEAATGEKKPQWLWLAERGSSFGYNNLVVDMTALPIMRGLGVPVIFDATHSVQLPGGGAGGKITGGRRDFVAPLARAAVSVGCDGLFMETHPQPEMAKSDAANAFPLDEMPNFIEVLESLREVLHRHELR